MREGWERGRREAIGEERRWGEKIETNGEMKIDKLQMKKSEFASSTIAVKSF